MQKLKLLNYTTSVPPEKSILEIEKLLARAGATKIAKDYDGAGDVVAFFFSLPTAKGDLLIRLPCNIENVYTVMMNEIKKPQHDTEKRIREQSHRIAWRIVLDSVTVDITRITLGQVKLEQVFLPYMIDPQTGQTFFEYVEQRNFKFQLPSGECKRE